MEAKIQSSTSAPVPEHVAVIMDGNGRWAAARGLPRALGHRKGVDAARRTVRHAQRCGIRHLTLYSFSLENWKRPTDEVSHLLALLRDYVRTDLDELASADIRISIIGDRARLAPDLAALVAGVEARTADNTGMHLIVAFNYGGRDEITRAARALAAAAVAGTVDPAAIDEAMVARFLDTAGVPDPDLVIRTSGERRISNFLLWQSAYAEYVFAPAMWPDFDEAMFDAALSEYETRTRRFGNVAARASAS